MFEILVESGVPRPVGLGPRVASLSVHGMVLVAAGLGWRQSVGEVPPKPVSLPIDIIEEPAPTPARPALGSGSEPGRGILPAAPDLPLEVPTTIPPVTSEVKEAERWPTAQALVRRELWGSGPQGRGSEPEAVPLAGEVDEPVTVLRAREPVYPAALAAGGIAGEVRVEFVVDTTGRCEASSLRVLSSTAPALERAAIDAILGTRFRAARAQGRPVRQLVHQRVSFRVK